MSWQLLKAMSRDHIVDDLRDSDMFAFEMNEAEGHIRIHYRVTRSGGNLRVQFETLEVLDDKEIGSGDWRIIAKVNSMNCNNSPEEHWSIGTGSSASLSSFRSVPLSPGATLTVYCKVEEEDS